jgi:cell division protein ZapA (FtsZ GTPase activity inhibitor)
MSKYFTYIYVALLLIAGVLIMSNTFALEERLQTMESQIDKMNIMLKDITGE